ncbi:MAG: hypothetical protein WDW38_011031 [Sanguina aurantia]
MRDPGKPKAKAAAKAKGKKKSSRVFRPGIDPMAEDEELQYDATAYDCYHKFQLDWSCLSFDVLKDHLGGPRSTYPHQVLLATGTQAPNARQNYIAFLKLDSLGQGRHGKKPVKKKSTNDDSDSEDDEDSESSSDDDSDGDEEMKEGGGDPAGKPREPKATFHFRMINHMGGINRIRSMPQKPGVVAAWADSGAVRVYDGSSLIEELLGESESSSSTTTKAKAKSDIKPLHSHAHSDEGYALDWSVLKPGRLASGDCKGKVHVWEPEEGGRWNVSGAYSGHSSSAEDLQWSPSEETVFASCSVDKTIAIWDTRERGKPMLQVKAHDCDVNVISWNKTVNYMMASGADDGAFRIWDLRAFTQGSHVSHFGFHRAAVTSIEWCPYEGSMLATCSADNQLAVWDLALERDPEEEAALAAEGNAAAPEDMPAQLMFLHAGQNNLKELHWHSQIPGMLLSTAGDGFDLFKPSNL